MTQSSASITSATSPTSPQLQIVVGLGDAAVEYYNGSGWSQLQDTGWSSSVKSMAVTFSEFGTPQIVVGLGNSSVQYYNGSSWNQLQGTGWGSSASQLAVQWTSANPLVVVGLGTGAVEYYNGSGWSQLQGTGWDNSVNCMEVNWPASGNPQVVVGLGNSSVQYYNGSGWSQLQGTGWKNSVGSMAVNWNGAGTPEVVVGLGNGTVQYYNGSSWNQLQGMGWGSNAGQLAVQWTSADPQVVVGLNSGAVEYYNGNGWSQLQDTGWGSSVTGMEVNWPASGAPQVVVALSDGSVQYYNGSSWNQLQGSGWGSSAGYLQVNWLGLENPQIIVGLADGTVQSFDGSSWSQLQGAGWGSAIACGSAQWAVSPLNGSTTPQNTCSVNNNLILPTNPSTAAQSGWDGGIVVISGYNTTNATTVCYLQSNLILLSFISEGTTSQKQINTMSNVLPLGETGTLELLPYYEPEDETLVNTSYTLLISQSNNYFPVATVSEDKGMFTFPAIPVLPLAPCNSSSAANAYVFQQNIMAYPSSSLAQQFTAALNADCNAGTGEDTNLDAFFAQTINYQNVNFQIYSAVCSYLSAYAYAWANFQPTYTYNFYSVTPDTSDSSSTTDSTSVKVNEQYKSLGTVVFTQSGPTLAAVSDANAGYAINWNPTGGSAVSLNFVDEQLVNANSDGFSAICLQCTFVDMAQMTGNSDDTGTPIQALVGLINGTNVIGSPVDLSRTFSAKEGQVFDRAMNSNVFKAFQLIMVLKFGIDCMRETYDYIKDKCASGEKPSSEEIADKEAELKDDAQEKAEDAGNDEEVKTGDSLSEAQASDEPSVKLAENEEDEAVEGGDISEETIINANDEAIEEDELSQQASEVHSQQEIENDPATEAENSTIVSDRDQLDEVDPESSEASETLENIQTSIDDNQTAIVDESTSLGNATSANVVKQQDTVSEEEADESEEQEKEDEDGDEDGDGDGDGDLGDLGDLE